MPDSPVLCVLEELVIDLLPVPAASAGPEGTGPQYVARPGDSALDVAVAAGRLAAPVRLMGLTGLMEAGVTAGAGLEALSDEQLLALVDDAALVAALNCTRVGADPPTRAELHAVPSTR